MWNPASHTQFSPLPQSHYPRRWKFWLSFTLTLFLNVATAYSQITPSGPGGQAPGETGRILRYDFLEGQPANTIIANIKTDSGLAQRHTPPDLNLIRFSFKRPPTSSNIKSSIVSSSPHDYFLLNSETGVLSSSRIFDREEICGGASASESLSENGRCELNADVVVLPAPFYDVIRISVRLVDINDNAPVFSMERVTIEIDESSRPGSEFSLPQATDPDEGFNGIQSYRLVPTPDIFELVTTRRNPSTLEVKIRLKGILDRESYPSYQLTLQALDGGAPPLDGSLTLYIVVKDANDNPPVFDPPIPSDAGSVSQIGGERNKGDRGIHVEAGESSVYEVGVLDSLVPGTLLVTLHASDRDQGSNGHVVYRLEDRSVPSVALLFSVDRERGEIRTKAPLAVGVYHLIIIAEDGGSPPLQATARVNVRVRNGRNHGAVISVTSVGEQDEIGAEGEKGPDAVVMENAPIGTFVAHLRVEDPDSGPAGQVTCYLVNSTEFSLVSHYANEYVLTTANAVFDRESRDLYHAYIACKDASSAPVTSERMLEVAVLDDNDHAPQVISHLEQSIVENNPIGIILTKLNATDSDIGSNSQLYFSLSNHQITKNNTGASLPAISINASSGVITAAVSFDYEVATRHVFEVVVRDSGAITQRSATTTLTLNVVDSNDESPRFTRGNYFASVPENLPPGYTVVKGEATDADITAEFRRISYAFLSNTGSAVTLLPPFLIDSQTGDITTVQALDRESVASYTLTLLAQNEGFPERTGSATLIVYVQDVNDNKPVFLDTVKGAEFGGRSQPIRNRYESHVACDTPSSALVAVVKAVDMDDGVNGTVSYHIISPSESDFNIDLHDGIITRSGAIQSTPYCGIYRLKIEARDGGDPYLKETADVVISFNASLSYTRIMTQVTPEALASPLTNQPLLLIPIIVSAILFVLLIIGLAGISVYCWRRRRSKRAKACQQIRLSQQLLQQLPEHQQLLMEQLCRCKSLPTVEWDRDKDMTIQIKCSNDRIYRPGIHRNNSNCSCSSGGGNKRSGSCYTIDLNDLNTLRGRGEPFESRGGKQRPRSQRLSIPAGYRGGGYTSDIESDSGCSGSDCFDRRHTDEGSAATRSSPENPSGLPYSAFSGKPAGYSGTGTDSDSSIRARDKPRRAREELVTPYHVTGLIGGKSTPMPPYFRGQVDKEEMPMLLESSIE